MKLFTKFLFLLLILSNSLFAQFISLETSQVEEAIKNGVPVIDIRRVDEYKKYGIIKGSYTITFFDEKGDYNIKRWMAKFTQIVKSKDQTFILVCAHANRSKVVAKFLDKQLHYKNVRELDGGIMYGWIDKGRKTVIYRSY